MGASLPPLLLARPPSWLCPWAQGLYSSAGGVSSPLSFTCSVCSGAGGAPGCCAPLVAFLPCPHIYTHPQTVLL